MSCACSNNPCQCPGGCSFVDPCEAVNPEPNCRTKCNQDTRDNMWYVPDQPGFDCKCKLDNMTYGQVIRVLETVPYSARQLAAITDDPCLLLLARTVKLVVPIQEDDEIAEGRLNANSIPYYTGFGGNVDGGVRGRRRPGRTRSE